MLPLRGNLEEERLHGGIGDMIGRVSEATLAVPADLNQVIQRSPLRSLRHDVLRALMGVLRRMNQTLRRDLRLELFVAALAILEQPVADGGERGNVFPPHRIERGNAVVGKALR